MGYLKIKNWEEYQHYKDRNPPWIKLHVKTLNDRAFTDLSSSNRGLLIQLWILASENEGQISNDLEEIKYRLRDTNIKQKDLNSLIEKGFLSGCKHMIANDSECYSETETETEKNTLFEQFWQAYPKKKSRGQAEKAWLKIKPKPDEQLLATMIATIERAKKSVEWVKDSGQFIPYPATWLNAKGWEDEIRGLPEIKAEETAPMSCQKCGDSGVMLQKHDDGKWKCRPCYTGLANDEVIQKIEGLVKKAFNKKN